MLTRPVCQFEDEGNVNWRASVRQFGETPPTLTPEITRRCSMIAVETSRPKIGQDHDPEVSLIQTLIKNWWLLALCGVLDAIYSVTNLLVQGPDGSLTLRQYAVPGTVVFLGKVALAAGACTIVAGTWRSAQGKSWILVLNGLALGALGAIFTFWTGPLAFRTVALLLVIVAMSNGIFEWVIARAFWRPPHVADEWFLGLAGASSVGFAFVFFALAFHWIKLEPGSHEDFLWFGSYFGFSAICMLGLALRLHSLRAVIHRMAGSALPTG